MARRGTLRLFGRGHDHEEPRGSVDPRFEHACGREPEPLAREPLAAPLLPSFPSVFSSLPARIDRRP